MKVNIAKVKKHFFLPIFNDLTERFNIKLRQEKNDTFLDKWYFQQVRNEIDFVFEKIKKIENVSTKK
jgi:hypothetical protein